MSRPEIRLASYISNEGTVHMIVIGVEAHKRTHTLVAVDTGFRGVPGLKLAGTCLTFVAGLGRPRWNGTTFPAVAAVALLLEPESTIA